MHVILCSTIQLGSASPWRPFSRTRSGVHDFADFASKFPKFCVRSTRAGWRLVRGDVHGLGSQAPQFQELGIGAVTLELHLMAVANIPSLPTWPVGENTRRHPILKICMYIYIYVYIHMYVYIYIHTYIYIVYMYTVYIYKYVYTDIFIHKCACWSISLYCTIYSSLSFCSDITNTNSCQLQMRMG